MTLNIPVVSFTDGTYIAGMDSTKTLEEAIETLHRSALESGKPIKDEFVTVQEFT